MAARRDAYLELPLERPVLVEKPHPTPPPSTDVDFRIGQDDSPTYDITSSFTILPERKDTP